MNPSPKTALVILGDASSSDGQSQPSMMGDAIIAINDKDKLALALQDMMPSSLESITLHINDIIKFDPMAVAGLIEPLEEKGTFRIVLPTTIDDTSKLVSKAFLLAGLTAESEQRLTDGTRTYTAVKKPLVTNGGRKLNLGTEEEKKQDDGRVLLNADDDDDDDDNLIDEDALLDGGNVDDMLAPPDMTAKTISAGDDCGGRKACDNCTCGRAEREKGETQSKQVPTSSCGNCAKGDAFRCASCPFLGKPAFKPGEEHLILELTDDL